MDAWVVVLLIVTVLVACTAYTYAGYQYGFRRGFDAGEEYQYGLIKQEMAQLDAAHKKALERIEAMTDHFAQELGERGKEWLQRWQNYS